MNTSNIGLIGYGEVGRIFSAGLRPKPGVRSVLAWDIKFKAGVPPEHVQPQPSMQALCAGSDLVISAVTASNTLAVAARPRSTSAPARLPGPELRVARHQAGAAALIDAAGAFYVEAGVMTSVPPYGIKVPMLLGGARAAELAPVLQGWGMDAHRCPTAWAWPARSRCAAA
jgi:3-hydroxyisobutyrate dehydrogenase-like beta-hydroxyacid dehydrogenase